MLEIDNDEFDLSRLKPRMAIDGNCSRPSLITLPCHLLHLICQLLIDTRCFEDVLNLRLVCFPLYDCISDAPLKIKLTRSLPTDHQKLAKALNFIAKLTNWSFNSVEFQRKKLLEGPDLLMNTKTAANILLKQPQLFRHSLDEIQLDGTRQGYRRLIEPICQDDTKIKLKSFISINEIMSSPLKNRIKSIELFSIMHLTNSRLSNNMPCFLECLENVDSVATVDITLLKMESLKVLKMKPFDAVLVPSKSGILLPKLEFLELVAFGASSANASRITRDSVPCDLFGFSIILDNAPSLKSLHVQLNCGSMQKYRRIFGKNFKIETPPTCKTVKTSHDTMLNVQFSGILEELCVYNVGSVDFLIEWLGQGLRILNIVVIHWVVLHSRESILNFALNILAKQPNLEVLSIRYAHDYKPCKEVKLSGDLLTSGESFRNLKLLIVQDEVIHLSASLDAKLIRRINHLDDSNQWFIRREFQLES